MRLQPQAVQQYFVFGVFVISLWSTITNLVPLSASFVLLLPLIPYALAQNPSLPRCVTALLGLYGYFLLSTLLYGATSLVEPDFYRRDGNFFATMMPILLGGIFSIHTDVEKLAATFLKWATFCNLLCLGLYAGTGGDLVVRESGIYHFLFLSHNAAGGFISMLVALGLGVLLKNGWSLVQGSMLAINLLALVVSKSRGSMFGLMLALFLVVALRERFLKSIIATIAATTALVLYFTYPAWLMMGKPPGMGWEGPTPFAATNGDVVNSTFLDRVMFLWPRAVDLFLKSPIFGTGFGSYNDIPYRFSGIPHVFMYNRPYKLVFNSAHAHNTFLHVLAETGLVGFGLLMAFLYHLWRYIDGLESQSLRVGMKLAFWFAVFSSLTEHRLFTPAEMFPFTILLGIALAGRAGIAARPGASMAAPVAARTVPGPASCGSD